jgi:hypothetical protein
MNVKNCSKQWCYYKNECVNDRKRECYKAFLRKSLIDGLICEFGIPIVNSYNMGQH